MISIFPRRETNAALISDGFKTMPIKDVTRLSQYIAIGFPWSHCVWTGGKRAGENFISSHFCVLDFDGDFPLAEALDYLQDMVHVIGTTKSHGIEGDCFRVVMPWSEPVTSVDILNHSTQAFYKKYPGDNKTRDGGRFWFPCKEIVSLSTEGDLAPVIKTWISPQSSESVQYQKAQADLFKITGEIPAWCRDFLDSGKLWQAEGREQTAFRVASALLRLGMPPQVVKDKILKAKVKITPDFRYPEELIHAFESALRYA